MNTVHSWDIFDTLIGRKCGTPQRLWEQLAASHLCPTFPAERRAAEARLQATREEYSLDDIYQELQRNGHHEVTADDELQAERDNVFPIRRYADQVRPGDLLVSDMYLTEGQLRTLLDAAGVGADCPIHVACHHKSRGTIWGELLERHAIVQHTGDNPESDVERPKRHGIATVLAETGWSPLEAQYSKFSPAIAWWARHHRLTNRFEHDLTLTLQLQANAPLLRAALQRLRDLVQSRAIEQVGFLARDGCLAHAMWRRLYPEIPAEYLWSNRELLRRAEPDYLRYLAVFLTRPTVLFDLAASFQSFAVLAPHLPAVPQLYAAFLVRWPNRPTPELPIEFLLDHGRLRINNSYLEMLNYARHWHVASVTADGRAIFDQPGEYDLGLVSRYHAAFDSMLPDCPPDPIENPAEIASLAAEEIHRHGAALERLFPGHMAMERSRRLSGTAPQPTRPRHDLVIVGAIDRVGKSHLKPWLRSIQIAGYRGDLAMLCYREDAIAQKMLRQHHVEVRECQHDRHVVVDRFRDVAQLARELPPATWVVMLDVTDIVMQLDPTEWLARHATEHEIVVGSEAIRIKDQWWVDANLRDVFPEFYEQTREHLLYNAGSFAARASAMAQLAQDVWNLCCSRPYTKNNDQDAFNYLLHTDRYRDRVLFAPQGLGWCANVAATVCEPPDKGAAFATEPLATIDHGTCRVEHGVVPCFLHHYTRNKDWSRQVTRRIEQGARCK